MLFRTLFENAFIKSISRNSAKSADVVARYSSSSGKGAGGSFVEDSLASMAVVNMQPPIR